MYSVHIQCLQRPIPFIQNFISYIIYTVSATGCHQEVLPINVLTLNTTEGRVHIATVVDGGEEDAEEHDISRSNGWSDVAVISCISFFTSSL